MNPITVTSRIAAALTLIFLLSSAAGCGQTGPLYLPQSEAAAADIDAAPD